MYGAFWSFRYTIYSSTLRVKTDVRFLEFEMLRARLFGVLITVCPFLFFYRESSLRCSLIFIFFLLIGMYRCGLSIKFQLQNFIFKIMDKIDNNFSFSIDSISY